MKKLEKTDMKNVMGGSMPPPATLWNCDTGGGNYANVCYTINPEVPCNYAAGACTSIGLCNKFVNVCLYP